MAWCSKDGDSIYKTATGTVTLNKNSSDGAFYGNISLATNSVLTCLATAKNGEQANPYNTGTNVSPPWPTGIEGIYIYGGILSNLNLQDYIAGWQINTGTTFTLTRTSASQVQLKVTGDYYTPGQNTWQSASSIGINYTIQYV